MYTMNIYEQNVYLKMQIAVHPKTLLPTQLYKNTTTTVTSSTKTFRYYEAQIEVESQQQPEIEPRTADVSCQCSASKLWQLDNNQTLILNACLSFPDSHVRKEERALVRSQPHTGSVPSQKKRSRLPRFKPKPPILYH